MENSLISRWKWQRKEGGGGVQAHLLPIPAQKSLSLLLRRMLELLRQLQAGKDLCEIRMTHAWFEDYKGSLGF